MLEIKVFSQKKIVKGTKGDLESPKTAWAVIVSPRVSDWVELAKMTGLEASDLKEFLHLAERPVLRNLGQYSVVSFRSPFLSGRSIVTKPNLFLISEQRKQFFTVSQASMQEVSRISAFSSGHLEKIFREGPTRLLYSVLEEVIDTYRQILDHYNEEVDRIEGSVLEGKYTQDITAKIFQARKTLVYFVRALFANQEVVSAIEQGQGKFLDKNQVVKFRTLFEDIEQLEDLSTIYRDILSSSLQVHLSSISNNLNIVMKRLTSWAAIILVPSLIAGIYGMNVSWLPFTQTRLGSMIILVMMLVSVLLLYSYFSKKDWL